MMLTPTSSLLWRETLQEVLLRQHVIKNFQAILPLKGKPKNTWQDHRDILYANKEIEAISLAIGIECHDENNEADISKLRYGRINILADADVDGSHIQVLLLTLFFRHFPALVSKGHIFISQPPISHRYYKKKLIRKI